MKEGGAPDHGGLPLQGVTAGGKGVFEGGERGELLVDQRVVGELPEMFGGLKLGGVRRQVDEMNPLRDLHQRTDVIPRLVEHEHDSPGGTAPTARANASSATLMTAVLMVEANCHSLRPEAGCTKASR